MVKNIILGCIVACSFSLAAMENSDNNYEIWVWHYEDGNTVRPKRKYQKKKKIESVSNLSDSSMIEPPLVAPIDKMAIDYILNKASLE